MKMPTTTRTTTTTRTRTTRTTKQSLEPVELRSRLKTFNIQNSSFLSFSYFDNEALFSIKLKGFLVKQNGQWLLA
jgi:hypothetical protein